MISELKPGERLDDLELQWVNADSASGTFLLWRGCSAPIVVCKGF